MGWICQPVTKKACAICAKWEALPDGNCCPACETLHSSIAIAFRKGDPDARKGMPK